MNVELALAIVFYVGNTGNVELLKSYRLVRSVYYGVAFRNDANGRDKFYVSVNYHSAADYGEDGK
jgi:hypothetical protein